MPMLISTWKVLNNLVKKNCPIKNVFTDFEKIKQLVIVVKKLDSHVSDEDYLKYKKVWNEFNTKNMGEYHDHYSAIS